LAAKSLQQNLNIGAARKSEPRVAMLVHNGSSTVYGMMGDVYQVGPDRIVMVRKCDVLGLKQAGLTETAPINAETAN
jgi:hypothetical protein